MDIRSDLYSLGLVLWEMLTGKGPFKGAPAELMHRHQHVPLPLEQLEGVPRPVVALLEKLLEKLPVRRFQTPAGLLNAMTAITEAMDGGRTVVAFQQCRPRPLPIRFR